ncbi:MAG: DnaJ domain-containing protein [Deltaproteobacteria bacterium]|nr:DnaJ domain-containing protein [Deltaproteobacteria bacterium]
MNRLEETLSLRLTGAEVLARIAVDRADGCLTYVNDARELRLLFKGGRPEGVAVGGGDSSVDRAAVIGAVRGLAVATAGRCSFAAGTSAIATSLSLDTMGEALVGLVHGMSNEVVHEVVSARREAQVEPTPLTAKLATVIAKVAGTPPPVPSAATALEVLLRGAGVAEERALLALWSLGGLRRVTPAPVTKAGPAVPARAVEESMPLPTEPKARAAALEIQAAHARLAEATYYQVLDVATDATAEQVREAYFKVAKRWHSDTFGGLELGPEIRGLAEDLFRVAGEAQHVLCDAGERKTYDFILDRKAKGLPTDVNVILEAEALFHKAKVLVRRGQAAAAEPSLRQAVELNKGEAEFWAYFGFAVHAAKGADGLTEARAALQRALEMNPKLDEAYEFLGRIARVEGQMGEAERQLRKALELKPKNLEAVRELRLIVMRGAKNEEQAKGAARLFGGLFAKK